MVAADYMLKVAVSNFRNAWESMGEDGERVDEYGLGPRGSLAEAVRAVIDLLGMQPCEVCAYVFISYVHVYFHIMKTVLNNITVQFMCQHLRKISHLEHEL